MSAIRRLANPPITEALIDFRVKARPDLKASEFDGLRSKLGSAFPKVAEQVDFEMQVEFGGAATSPSLKTHPPRGLMFGSADGRDNAQFRVDGFTFNRLKPYTSWDDIFPKAMGFWDMYVSIARPQAITRVAVRYLNAFQHTTPITALRDVFRAPPVVPEELPQAASRFTTMVTIHDPKRRLTAHVGQSMHQPQGQGPVQVAIDIDAFRHENVPTDTGSLTDVFANLRDYKNEIFFSLLTEQKIKEFE